MFSQCLLSARVAKSIVDVLQGVNKHFIVNESIFSHCYQLEMRALERAVVLITEFSGKARVISELEITKLLKKSL